MKTVWKAELALEDEQAFVVPAGAKALSVQFQQETLCLWYLCEPDNEPHSMTVWIRGTGHDYDETGEFVDTIQVDGGRLIFHVFAEEGPWRDD